MYIIKNKRLIPGKVMTSIEQATINKTEFINNNKKNESLNQLNDEKSNNLEMHGFVKYSGSLSSLIPIFPIDQSGSENYLFKLSVGKETLNGVQFFCAPER